VRRRVLPERRRGAHLTLLLLVIGLAGCGSEPPALVVDGVAFSQDQLLGISESRLEVLGSLALFGAAVSEGSLEVVAVPVGEQAEVEDLARALRVEELLAEARVETAVLEERYRTNPSYELTVRHLVVLSERYETDATRAEARDRAAAGLARIEAGEPFPGVAGEVSEEPGAADRGGLLQPGREGTWVDEFWTAASALQVGEVSGVVESPFGFHVLKLEGRDTIPFPEVRDRVAREVGGMLGSLPASIDEAPLPAGLTVTGGGEGVDIVARFDGGEVTADRFRLWAATLPAPRWDAYVAGDASAREEALHRAARAADIRARGSSTGIAADPRAGPTAREAWARQAQGWAAALGFTPGLRGEPLAEAVLEGLGRSGQLADLARRDVHDARPLLEYYAGLEPYSGDEGGR